MTKNISGIEITGRLGTKQNLNDKIAEARKAGAVIEQDFVAGTVVARFHAVILFRAMAKDANTWIIMYNKEYYPEESDETIP